MGTCCSVTEPRDFQTPTSPNQSSPRGRVLRRLSNNEIVAHASRQTSPQGVVNNNVSIVLHTITPRISATGSAALPTGSTSKSVLLMNHSTGGSTSYVPLTQRNLHLHASLSSTLPTQGDLTLIQVVNIGAQPQMPSPFRVPIPAVYNPMDGSDPQRRRSLPLEAQELTPAGRVYSNTSSAVQSVLSANHIRASIGDQLSGFTSNKDDDDDLQEDVEEIVGHDHRPSTALLHFGLGADLDDAEDDAHAAPAFAPLQMPSHLWQTDAK